jgi:hypothetical protein
MNCPGLNAPRLGDFVFCARPTAAGAAFHSIAPLIELYFPQIHVRSTDIPNFRPAWTGRRRLRLPCAFFWGPLILKLAFRSFI